jgi:hypothetical protein
LKAPPALACSGFDHDLFPLAFHGKKFPDDPLFIRFGRDGFIGLSPRSFPAGTNGIGRPAWLCAVALSGRRKRRKLSRTAIGRYHHRTERSIECRMVFSDGSACDRRSVESRRLVQTQHVQDQSARVGAFGMAGIGSAVLGRLADYTSIEFVFRVCAFLPLLGLLTGFLPDRKSQPASLH